MIKNILPSGTDRKKLRRHRASERFSVDRKRLNDKAYMKAKLAEARALGIINQHIQDYEQEMDVLKHYYSK